MLDVPVWLLLLSLGSTHVLLDVGTSFSHLLCFHFWETAGVERRYYRMSFNVRNNCKLYSDDDAISMINGKAWHATWVLIVEDQRLAMDSSESQKQNRNMKREAEERVTDFFESKFSSIFIFENPFRSLGSRQRVTSLLPLQFFIRFHTASNFFPSSKHHGKTEIRSSESQ